MLPLLHFATPDQMAIKIRKMVNGKKSANFPVGNHRWSTLVLVYFSWLMDRMIYPMLTTEYRKVASRSTSRLG